MFKWLKDKGQESLKNQLKFTIDDCGELLSKSLDHYYNNHFVKNISETQTNRTGIERFYLYMSAAFGYCHTDVIKFAVDNELLEYFFEYIPLRIVRKFDEKIGEEVFKGFDFGLSNVQGTSEAFGYAAHIAMGKTCELTMAAARTGGHMLNAFNKKLSTIPADDIYLEFRKKGSLFRDGDKIISGLQLIFDNKDLELHKLKVRI